MLIDSHAHLNFKAFESDLNKIINRALLKDIRVLNVGSKYETSKKAVDIAESYKEGVYASIGLHPVHVATGVFEMKTDPEEGEFRAQGEAFDKEKYAELAKSEKVVAIGEIGLDYYYKPKSKIKIGLFKDSQKKIFIEQLGLAGELDLPIIFHCRMAHDDLINIIKDHKKKNPNFRGVVHCFTGDSRQAEEYLKLGLHLGFNGIMFKLNLDKVIGETPLDRILVETDSPYLTPPQAGAMRNEPVFVEYIADRIAKIKNIDYKQICHITTLNARKLFNI